MTHVIKESQLGSTVLCPEAHGRVPPATGEVTSYDSEEFISIHNIHKRVLNISNNKPHDEASAFLLVVAAYNYHISHSNTHHSLLEYNILFLQTLLF